MRVGHLKEVTFEDITMFIITCVWILVIVIGKLLWLPKELVVWAVKNLWQAALLVGAVYGIWKLGDIVFYLWLGLEMP